MVLVLIEWGDPHQGSYCYIHHIHTKSTSKYKTSVRKYLKLMKCVMYKSLMIEVKEKLLILPEAGLSPSDRVNG